MKTIHKYSFPYLGSPAFTLELPEDYCLLAVQVQDGVPCLWALVDTDMPKRVYRFQVFGSGSAIPDVLGVLDHVATFQMPPYVWHLFYLGESR
jgi:hypothetical protein